MKADRLAEQKSTRYERRKETAVEKGRKSPPDKSRRSGEVDDGRTAIVRISQAAAEGQAQKESVHGSCLPSS